MPCIRGFTLAELLIALVILGVIATFTIPKVLQNQADSKKKAIFRESIASVVDILNEGIKNGQLSSTATNKGKYFLDRLNAVKICSSDAAVQGCWNAGIQGSIGGNEENDPGVMMHNGSVIIGLNDNGASTYNAWVVDWNGVEGPNTLGEDQLWLRMCWGPGNCSVYAGSGPNAPGSIGPHASGSAANTTLYQTLFQN